MDTPLTWHRVAVAADVPDGRVVTVAAGRRTLALTHVEGAFGALDNRCPHQGGPLGEGSIERGWLRCPWHGYDYDPLTGEPPEGFDDAPACFETEVRDGEVFVALPPERPRHRTVSDVLVETMVAWGVTHVFGIVGHSNLGFAESMRVAEERGDLTYIGVRHEGAASFAASAYGKLTGRPGVCFAIAGPGATNLLTGLYDARVDRSPVLALTGQVPSSVRGRGAFQDVDLEAAFADVAAYSETVHLESDHAELMTLACKEAVVGRRVAHLVLPDEVQPHVVADDVPAAGPDGRTADTAIAPPIDALARATERIAGSERPLVIVGAGARAHMTDVVALAELIGAPVATTFKAKGQISDHHPLGCGVMGRSGTPIASWFMNESDLLVVFGASFSNHTGIAPYKPTIQVDGELAALGRFHAVDVPVLGDIGVTARTLLTELNSLDRSCIDHRPEVAQRWSIWRTEKRSRLADQSREGMGAVAVFDSLQRHAPGDAVMPVDVGNNTYSFGRYFEVDEQTILMSGYLGSIGFALPAAMGAWAALAATGDGRRVVAVAGDGGFGQYAMELTTAVKYGMDITVVLLNNGQFGKISKEQRAEEYDVWQTSLHNPDFARFAELCGAVGRRVTGPEELDDAIEAVLDHRGPSLVEIVQDPLAV